MTATGLALERSLLLLLAERGAGKTICPSEAARAVGGDDWRALMEPARAAARRLTATGLVEITQRGAGGESVDGRWPDPNTSGRVIRGPYG